MSRTNFSEGKTDYYARKRLIVQDKNKYNSPKYRLVVRLTNKDVICQIVYSRIQGDVVLTSAYSHELPQYGVKCGLTNYAAAYCTGLLCARRALAKLGLDSKYEGQKEADGEIFTVEDIQDGPRAFKAFLDVGLRRTTTGARIFGAMKGAVDGGINVPHSEKRFPGYDKDTKAFDAETLRSYIYGGHVADYMALLKEEDNEVYLKQFAEYVKNGIESEDLEDLYKEAHASIRANPVHVKKPAKDSKESKKFRKTKLNYKQRKNKIAQKKAAFARKLEA